MRIHIIASSAAFAILFAMRLYWLFFAQSIPFYQLDGIPMLNNNDGYYYAEGARDIIAGFHQESDLSPVAAPLSLLTAWIARLLPFSLDWVTLFMPAVFGSLVAFPLYFLFVDFVHNAHSRLVAFCGFFGALFGGSAVSYYNRTMMGYYDTDMLLLVLPLCMLYCLFKFIKKSSKIYLSTFLFFGIMSVLWHNGLVNIFQALFAICIALLCWEYLCTRFFTNIHGFRIQQHQIQLIAAAISILLLPTTLMQALVGLLALATPTRYFTAKYLCLFIASVMLLATFLGGFDSLFYQIQAYFFHVIPQNTPLIFYNVVSTIRETSSISVMELIQRITSNPILFILALGGFVVLCWKEPLFLLSLPFVLLGFAGITIGLRFTIFATPFLALGLACALLLFLSYMHHKLALILSLPLAVLLLLPNLTHILRYKVPSIFEKQEAKLLTFLTSIAKPDDYLITWWDYGYGARYYGNIKTLIDGGKHSGAVNYPVSLMLSTPNMAASSLLANLTVATTEKYFNKDDDNAIVQQLLHETGINNPQDFLYRLDNGMIAPFEWAHDIFYYIPIRMFSIFDVIQKFSNIDFKGAALRDKTTFYVSDSITAQESKLIIDSHLSFDTKMGLLYHNDKIIPIKTFIKLIEDGSSPTDFIATRPYTERINYDNDSYLYAIYFQAQNMFLICDEYSFYSTALTLFVFGDNDYFTLVASNPTGRIFKRK